MKKYVTREKRVRYPAGFIIFVGLFRHCFRQSKTIFISSRHHVISSVYDVHDAFHNLFYYRHRKILDIFNTDAKMSDEVFSEEEIDVSVKITCMLQNSGLRITRLLSRRLASMQPLKELGFDTILKWMENPIRFYNPKLQLKLGYYSEVILKLVPNVFKRLEKHSEGHPNETSIPFPHWLYLLVGMVESGYQKLVVIPICPSLPSKWHPAYLLMLLKETTFMTDDCDLALK